MPERKIHPLAPEYIIPFVKGGKASISIHSLRTGNWERYYIAKPKDKKTGKPEKDPEVLFVYSRHKNGFWFIGTIFIKRPFNPFKYSHKSQLMPQETPVLGFKWFWLRVRFNIEQLKGRVVVYHENRCAACNYRLTDPPSIVTGFGPKCRPYNVRTPGRAELRKLGYTFGTKKDLMANNAKENT